MPIYEYLCTKCGSHFEKRQNISDGPLKICEKCGGGLEKQWSLSGFQFKGEGWYVTDYSKNKNSAGDNGSAAEKNADAESTPAAASASKEKSTEKTTEKPATKS